MIPAPNADNETIAIPLSKTKIILMLLGSLVFVAGGISFIINPANYSGIVNGQTWPITITGYASIVFFGVCAIALSSKLFNNAPGLVIDKKGITDNSSGVSTGFIGWDDITRLSISQVMSQRFILVHVIHPDEYIQRQRNIFKRKALSANYATYDTPISITANGLQCNFDELYALLISSLDKYKSNQ